ncbi:SNF8 protein, partial [Dicaeum eximium]|nr:SNF8 protein [Dicaeum eximium]
LSQMCRQLQTFRSHLEAFASKHKQEIRRSPAFRRHFQDMCATIGVDPLACEPGGGGAGVTWKWGLGIPWGSGGLIPLQELQQQVLKGRGKLAQDVSQDDLLRAIKKLKVLGSGFGLVPAGGTLLVQSVPAELNMDHSVVLQLAEKKGFVTVSEIQASLKWETERAKQVLEHLLKEGLAWLDAQAPAEPQFWLPALFSELHGQEGTAPP